MTGRLLALVLVPLVGLTGLVVATVQPRRQTVALATTIQEAVDRIARLATLRAALVRERTYAEVAGAGRALGLSMDEMTTLVGGFELGAGYREAVAATDAAVVAAPYPELVTAAQVAEIRSSSGSGGLTEETLTAPYQALFDRLLATMNRTLSSVEDAAEDVPGGPGLVRELTAVREPLVLSEDFGQEMLRLERVFFRVGDVAAARQELGRLAYAELASYEALLALPDDVVTRAATALLHDPSTEYVHRVVQDNVRGEAPDVTGGAPAMAAAAAFNLNALRYVQRFPELVGVGVTRTAELAASLRADAERHLRLWTMYGAGLVLASIALSLVIARSITRPLRRLAGHAGAVSAGDLGVGQLPTTGPQEIAVTTGAFNDLVGNLRLLDAKARALAELDFDADALAEPLPGPLGESLQRSASTLSGSLSERDELRSRILYQASYDDVTELRNRSAAVDVLDQALARARAVGRGLAVVVFDIDDFTRINDTHGRALGDALLRHVGGRVSVAAAVSALVARVGNDEFAVIIENVVDPGLVTQLARQIVAACHAPTRVEGVSLAVSVSAGVAFSWDGSDHPEELLRGAGLALSRAKGRGPATIELFDAELQRQLLEHAAVEDALTGALATDDELVLHYQPVISLDTGRMTSVEALVRWNRPGWGPQAPDAFIPVAERSPLIVELDRWVLNRAARQINTWRHDDVLGGLDVAINISGRHLTSQHLVAHVGDTLRAHALDPGQVIVELTETALVEDLVPAAAQLDAVRALGVRIALDDFGTGYTSVAHLRRLPLDIIKIDRSLVSRLDDRTDRALVRMITDLGHELGAAITAEGVETREQYELLRYLGCDRAQGFLMSRPLEPAALREWAAGQRSGSGAAPPYTP